jgi:4-diphosphocytidyl-2-C-methyl-D-erythritol kinase
MPVTVRSFAKINLGLCIGAPRADGFHDLRTVYQTIALHDIIQVSVERGSGIEVRCEDSRVPTDGSNTCYRIVANAMAALRAKGRVLIRIEKRLPVRGGLGGASSNAVATLLALERALKKQLSGDERLRISAEIGSDLPLFLIGGTVLGVGRGEEVYPVADLPTTPCVVAIPEIGVSTPQAFADWDERMGGGAFSSHHELRSYAQTRASARRLAEPNRSSSFTGANRKRTAGSAGRDASKDALTLSSHSDRMNEFSRRLSSWLSGLPGKAGKPVTGVPAGGRGRAESPLLDLVRTGIENDFEQVVFPKHPELREAKRVLEGCGASYASLSGSGSALYGMFPSREAAELAAARLTKQGTPAQATATITRRQYWQKIFGC